MLVNEDLELEEDVFDDKDDEDVGFFVGAAVAVVTIFVEMGSFVIMGFVDDVLNEHDERIIVEKTRTKRSIITFTFVFMMQYSFLYFYEKPKSNIIRNHVAYRQSIKCYFVVIPVL